MTTATKPPMQGGAYKAIDCCDGWVIVRDVPILSTVPKGVKGAPEDIKEDWMSDAVKFGQDLYTKGKTAYPIHLGHNDDLGITRPEFAGLFKPTRVGTALVEGKEQPAVFSDWKIKKEIFAKFAKGELPYVSPEVRNWSKRRISSLALLDSQPPHFAFPLQTAADLIEDPYAKFNADLPKECTIAKFDGMERVTFDPTVEEKTEPKQEEKPMADAAEKPKEDLQAGKPNNNPIDQKDATPSHAPGGNKMSMDDPILAAKFAAFEDQNAALKKRLDERDAQDKAKANEVKALESLKGYQIGDKAKAQIAKFAAEGEDVLNSLIETLKEVTPKDTSRNLGTSYSTSVSASDPAVAKFAQMGPDKLEAASKFASEYRTLKAHPAGKGMQITEEQYVKFQMDSADNTEGTHWGINIGSK